MVQRDSDVPFFAWTCQNKGSTRQGRKEGTKQHGVANGPCPVVLRLTHAGCLCLICARLQGLMAMSQTCKKVVGDQHCR